MKRAQAKVEPISAVDRFSTHCADVVGVLVSRHPSKKPPLILSVGLTCVWIVKYEVWAVSFHPATIVVRVWVMSRLPVSSTYFGHSSAPLQVRGGGSTGPLFLPLFEGAPPPPLDVQWLFVVPTKVVVKFDDRQQRSYKNWRGNKVFNILEYP